MKWQLQTQQGRPIAAGTIKQMTDYLNYSVPDGKYRLVGFEETLYVQRLQGLVHPLDELEKRLENERFMPSFPGGR